MLDFLTTNVEQLDLALEHISHGDANNARFGLMLTDNAVEITLHRIALDEELAARQRWYDPKPYEHAAQLRKALGKDFAPKVKFAKTLGKLGVENAKTISICHKFRNELYYVGLQHEAVLPAVSRFYFGIACGFLAKYSPDAIWYREGQELPRRAKAYFGDRPNVSEVEKTYQEACSSLAPGVIVESSEFSRVDESLPSRTIWTRSLRRRTGR